MQKINSIRWIPQCKKTLSVYLKKKALRIPQGYQNITSFRVAINNPLIIVKKESILLAVCIYKLCTIKHGIPKAMLAVCYLLIDIKTLRPLSFLQLMGQFSFDLKRCCTRDFFFSAPASMMIYFNLLLLCKNWTFLQLQ